MTIKCYDACEVQEGYEMVYFNCILGSTRHSDGAKKCLGQRASQGLGGRSTLTCTFSEKGAYKVEIYTKRPCFHRPESIHVTFWKHCHSGKVLALNL